MQQYASSSLSIGISILYPSVSMQRGKKGHLMQWYGTSFLSIGLSILYPSVSMRRGKKDILMHWYRSLTLVHPVVSLQE